MHEGVGGAGGGRSRTGPSQGDAQGAGIAAPVAQQEIAALVRAQPRQGRRRCHGLPLAVQDGDDGKLRQGIHALRLQLIQAQMVVRVFPFILELQGQLVHLFQGAQQVLAVGFRLRGYAVERLLLRHLLFRLQLQQGGRPQHGAQGQAQHGPGEDQAQVSLEKIGPAHFHHGSVIIVYKLSQEHGAASAVSVYFLKDT